jgi:hypothetical protein
MDICVEGVVEPPSSSAAGQAQEALCWKERAENLFLALAKERRDVLFWRELHAKTLNELVQADEDLELLRAAAASKITVRRAVSKPSQRGAARFARCTTMRRRMLMHQAAAAGAKARRTCR